MHDDLVKQYNQLIYEQRKQKTKDDVINFVNEIVTNSADQDDETFYQDMIDTLVRVVYCIDGEDYIAWLNFDDEIEPPTLKETLDEFYKLKDAQPTGSAPVAVGGGDGIRTHESFRTTCFRDRHIRPL